MEKMYLCFYTINGYDNYIDKQVFVTADESLAKLWVYKIDKVMFALRSRYESLETKFNEEKKLEYFYSRFNWDLQHECKNYDAANYRIIELR